MILKTEYFFYLCPQALDKDIAFSYFVIMIEHNRVPHNKEISKPQMTASAQMRSNKISISISK
jgi:hypothetical protein